VSQWLFEWFKLVQLCIWMMKGNVEDERTFSNLSFMKNKLCNHLTTHLNLVVKIYVQSFLIRDLSILHYNMQLK
jgi:hypothetical protein